MNPVEKVKAILDGLTEPLCKDAPLAAGGRKVVFERVSSETQNLSYQAFFNRISTFKPEYWGSNPNAAMYLAKYGFKTVSRCKVQCCSCHIEVDLEVFLGKAEVLQTLAVNSHKSNCRWLCVSTPKEYFEIPRNPHRILQDVKSTFTDLTTFESNLPLVLKENWLKMGISEDFMMAVLNFLEYPYSDTLASCVVLSLCGWVKSSDTTLQCNFCRRVVGVWNFFSEKNERPKPSASSKNSRVISLLYSEIRRSMMSCEDEAPKEGTCEEEAHEKEACVEEACEEEACEEEACEEEAFEEEACEEEACEEEACEEEACEEACEEEACEEEECEEEACEEESDEELNALTESRKSDADSPITSSIESEEEMSTSSCEEYCRQHQLERERERARIAFLRLNNWRDPNLLLKAKDLKQRALKFLWTKPRRFRKRYCYKVLRLKMENEFAASAQHEHDSFSPEHVIADGKAQFIHDNNTNNTDGSNNGIRADENNQPKVDAECDKDTNSVSRDENGYCSAEHNKSEESSMPCVKSPISPVTHLLENDKCSQIGSNSKVKSSGNVDHPDDTDAHLKPVGLKDVTCSSCHCVTSLTHLSNTNCDVETDTDKSGLHDKHSNCSNLLDVSVVPSKRSEKSCDISEVSCDESCGNSGGRRKRKRVPESKQNGTPYDEDEIPHKSAEKPIHFTRSKKKELEFIYKELPKSKPRSFGIRKVTVFNDEETLIKEIATTKVQEAGTSTTIDAMNDISDAENFGNNESVVTNHEESAELTPVIFSVVGNAVIPPDTPEEEKMESEQVEIEDQEFSSGPIIVSSKSICDESMLQEYVEEEGRNLENGYMAYEQEYSDISECKGENSLPKGDESKKTVSEQVSNFCTAKSSAVGGDAGSTQDNVQTSSCKRKREDSDVDSNCVNTKNNVEEFKWDLCRSYFHPELEHRYWCIWRVHVADYLKISCERKKGWEYYAEYIKKALELQNPEKPSVYQIASDFQNKALNCLSDIVTIARQEKMKRMPFDEFLLKTSKTN